MIGSASNPAMLAFDLGATSARLSLGYLVDGELKTLELDRISHETVLRDGHLFWDFAKIQNFVSLSVIAAARLFPNHTVGIDSWAVDHGFLNENGALFQSPIAYRDESHAAILEENLLLSEELYRLTGTQIQPFNTAFQLMARAKEGEIHPNLRWQLIPDLLRTSFGAKPQYELTNASHCALMGIDSQWSQEAFRLIGWPVPDEQPVPPGEQWEQFVTVGSHDTASAIFGLAPQPDELFLNLGTWGLIGVITEAPIINEITRRHNFSNERTVEGQIRLLRNIPGFYVLDALRLEFASEKSGSEWLEQADLSASKRIDLFSPKLLHLSQAQKTILPMLSSCPTSPEEWAGIALNSLLDTCQDQRILLESIVDRKFRQIRLGGGGAASDYFAQQLAIVTGLPVSSGPVEATVYGNFGVQIFASGMAKSLLEAQKIVATSYPLKQFIP